MLLASRKAFYRFRDGLKDDNDSGAYDHAIESLAVVEQIMDAVKEADEGEASGRESSPEPVVKHDRTTRATVARDKGPKTPPKKRAFDLLES